MTVNDVKALIDQACEYKPSDEDILQELAKLPSVEYDRARKLKAKDLGISVTVLDQEVKKYRYQHTQVVVAETQNIFPEIIPWEHAIKPEELLAEIKHLINRVAILPPHADTAITLWIVFSWYIEYVETAPILVLSSPEKRCGKTTVLSIIAKLVLKPLPASNITAAALFRTVEAWQPTLLIDEADTFIRASDELRGIINSGHTRSTATVIRTIGENYTPTPFSTWCAKVIALIGKLPETLHDRSIVIELQRKRSNEKVERIRDINPQVFQDLRRKLLRFSQDNGDWIKSARPKLPSDISDRAADNWEPLLAIAELVGTEWSNKAYQAAMFLSHQEKDAVAVGAELLRDIHRILLDNSDEKMPTQMLITELCKDEESPWSTYDNGKFITPRQLSSLLKQYGIQSKNIKLKDEKVVKGFTKDQFEDAWNRYLSPSTAENAATPLPEVEISSEINTLKTFLSTDQSATNIDLVIISATSENKQNSAFDTGGSGVADNLEGREENTN